jgi:hypothetical protein
MLLPERELKFLLDQEQTERFVAEAARHLVLDIHAGAPIAYTRTTYLDTPDLALYHAKGPLRRRLRIREYAAAARLEDEPVLTGVRFVELKESANGSRRKQRMRVPQDMQVDIMLDELGAHEQSVTPQLTTWYRRSSYRSEGLRVTLDHGVDFCRPIDLDPTRGPVRPASIAASWSETVLEVKLTGELPSWLRRTLGDTVATLGLSKFEAGMIALRESQRRSFAA